MIQRFGTIAHPPDKKRRLEKRERKRRQSLDGDGTWRRTSGERRSHDRRRSDRDEPPIIHLPFLDDIWEPEDEISETNAPDTNAPETNTADTDEDTKDTDQVELDADSDNADENETGKQRILTAAEQARLESLKSMLDASSARYKQASKNRRPVFAAGLEVKVINGDHAGKTGVVLDADYIANRALISVQDQETPHWIGFRSLGHTD